MRVALASEKKQSKQRGLRAGEWAGLAVKVTPGSTRHKSSVFLVGKAKLDSGPALAVCVSGDPEKPRGAIYFRVHELPGEE